MPTYLPLVRSESRSHTQTISSTVAKCGSASCIRCPYGIFVRQNFPRTGTTSQLLIKRPNNPRLTLCNPSCKRSRLPHLSPRSSCQSTLSRSRSKHRVADTVLQVATPRTDMKRQDKRRPPARLTSRLMQLFTRNERRNAAHRLARSCDVSKESG